MEKSGSSESFMDTVTFNKLKRVMAEGTGINFDCYRESYLKRRMNIRLTATKTNTYSNYIRYLKANPGEFRLLIDGITINYTKFFRDSDVYELLKETLLPEVLSSSKMGVRIWSAGCATGEEPYSLSMLIHEVAKKRLKDCKVTIYATDLDKTALEKAERGEYNRGTVQGIDKELLSKYFELEDDRYKVKPFVKQLIQFEEQDLMAPPKRRNFDLVLCRNVMIYFSKEIQQTIYMHFYDSLKAGGYLITGKTEFVGGEARKNFVEVNPRCRIYRRPHQTI